MAKKFEGLKKSQYVRYRDRKGHLRKFNPRILLIAEVWSKRSRKSTGQFLNKESDGKPVPRRWSKKAKVMFHERLIEKKRTAPRDGESFKIKYNKYVADQIPETLTTNINFSIDTQGSAQFYVRLWGKTIDSLPFNDKTSSQHWNVSKSHREWSEIIASKIVATIRDNKLRTSPKAWVKKFGNGRIYWDKNWSYMRFYNAQIIYEEDLGS